VWHSGCAPAFQAGHTGSIPVTRSSFFLPLQFEALSFRVKRGSFDLEIFEKIFSGLGFTGTGDGLNPSLIFPCNTGHHLNFHSCSFQQQGD
jgi:hypothetical protein